MALPDEACVVVIDAEMFGRNLESVRAWRAALKAQEADTLLRQLQGHVEEPGVGAGTRAPLPSMTPGLAGGLAGGGSLGAAGMLDSAAADALDPYRRSALAIGPAHIVPASSGLDVPLATPVPQQSGVATPQAGEGSEILESERFWNAVDVLPFATGIALGVIHIKRVVEAMEGWGFGIEEKVVNGRRYVILKGKLAGMRKALPGVRYLADNPQIMRAGIGTVAEKAFNKMVQRVTILLAAIGDVARYFLTDDMTFSQLVGSLSASAITAVASGLAGALLSKVAIAGIGAVVGATAIPVAATVAAGVVIGTLVAVIVSSLGVEKWLEDQVSRLCDWLAQRLRRLGSRAAEEWNQTVVPTAHRASAAVGEFWDESVVPASEAFASDIAAAGAYTASGISCTFDQFTEDDKDFGGCWR